MAKPRELDVPPTASGMRLDRYLSRRFAEYSRTVLARAIRAGLVTDGDGKPLRASTTVRAGDRLQIWVPGIAPMGDPPPFPPILHEDDRVVVIDKPAGLLTHPAGNDWAWAVISLARPRWAEADLVHRIDRDTSGLLVITKDPAANRHLKAAFQARDTVKEYDAIVRGHPAELVLDGPIGPADGPIRIQMAVRPDGLPARTDVSVVDRRVDPDWARVRCRIHTGRTHQIRVHLADAGFPLVGDRMYGIPPGVFLRAWEGGVDEETIRAAGAPRHALHSARLRVPHPDGGILDVEAPFPADLARWWADPSVLPLDSAADG